MISRVRLGRKGAVGLLLLVVGLLVGGPAVALPSLAAGAAGGPAGQPTLPTTPAVDLKVGVLPLASYGPFFVAQDKGYFRELGLNVDFTVSPSTIEQMAPLAQGQLHVAACSSNVPCFNALARGLDVAIVADLQSAGKTEKSTGNSALVVRKDLWDNGTIREAGNLVGRSLYVIAGEGSGHYVQAARWLRGKGIDPRSIDWQQMSFPDQLAAMQNRAIEVGVQTEPLVTAGVASGAHAIMATQEEMYPTTQILHVLYWRGIERLGPMVGERVMVAYLSGARDYINAFEYGVDEDTVVGILTRNTTIRDPALLRRIKYAWVDPNGVVNREALESDAALLRELGLLTAPLDLSGSFDDRYRQFALQHLGEYRAPR